MLDLKYTFYQYHIAFPYRGELILWRYFSWCYFPRTCLVWYSQYGQSTDCNSCPGAHTANVQTRLTEQKNKRPTVSPLGFPPFSSVARVVSWEGCIVLWIYPMMPGRSLFFAPRLNKLTSIVLSVVLSVLVQNAHVSYCDTVQQTSMSSTVVLQSILTRRWPIIVYSQRYCYLERGF